MEIYDLKTLNSFAKESNFNRDTLEKVLRLTHFLKLFNTHSELKGKYVLKGGTAINLCLFDLPRLSVDIDLNFNGKYNREEMEEMRLLHKKIISEEAALNGYTFSSKSRFSFSLDSYLFQYRNAAGGNDYIKLELNYSNRIQILSPVVYRTSSQIIQPIEVLALNKIELYATKIAALIGRTTVRDIFDVYQMVEKKIIKPEEVSLLRKQSLFFLVLANEFQTLEALLDRFSINMKSINYQNYKRNLIPMLQNGAAVDVTQYKNVVSSFVFDLFDLTIDEKAFVAAYNNGTFKAELLFNDEVSLKVSEHPMVMWKMKNFNKNE